MNTHSFPIAYQNNAKSCGPASLKMIAQYYGKDYSMEYLCDECGLTEDGVSLFGLSKCAKKIGFQPIAIRCTIKDIQDRVLLPAIALWEERHFIVIYDIDAKSVYVSDPSMGLINYQRLDFIKGWCIQKEGNGVLLALKPI